MDSESLHDMEEGAVLDFEDGASYHTRNTASDTEQEDTVEDVKWTNEDGTREKEFLAVFERTLRVTKMSGRAKLFICSRYGNIFTRYRGKYKRTQCLNNVFRVVISIGALLVPALLTIDDEVNDRSQSSQAIYYTTFGLSLLVSITSTVAELTQLSKRFYANATTNQILQQEGWAFLLLRGRYKYFSSHRECWQDFLWRVERINQRATSSDLMLYRAQESNSSTTKAVNSILDPTITGIQPETESEHGSNFDEEENRRLQRSHSESQETHIVILRN